jgi:hypothetical protein
MSTRESLSVEKALQRPIEQISRRNQMGALALELLDIVSPHLSLKERAEARASPLEYAWYVVPKLTALKASVGKVTHADSPLVGSGESSKSFTIGGSQEELPIFIRCVYKDGSEFPNRIDITYQQPVNTGYDAYQIGITEEQSSEIYGRYWKRGEWHYDKITEPAECHTILLSALRQLSIEYH